MRYETHSTRKHFLKAVYEKKKSTLINAINQEKQLYYCNKIINAFKKSKVMWQIIKQEVSSRSNSTSISIADENDQTVSNQQKVVELFIDHFLKTPDVVLDDKLVANLYNICSHKFIFAINAKEIESIIKGLPNKHSADLDDIYLAQFSRWLLRK